MTEQEWLTCTNMFDLLEYLRAKKWQRKLRLVACGCCRRVWHRLPDERSRRAVEAAEQFADGLIDSSALQEAHETACAVVREVGILHPVHAAAYVAAPVAEPAAYFSFQDAHEDGEPFKAQARWQLALVYDVFGNPFRPAAVEDSWLLWNDGTVPKIAQSIYDDRRFGDLPILADALVEAGCNNEDLLAHCRGPGPHARGCWLLDLLLGKG